MVTNHTLLCSVRRVAHLRNVTDVTATQIPHTTTPEVGVGRVRGRRQNCWVLMAPSGISTGRNTLWSELVATRVAPWHGFHNCMSRHDRISLKLTRSVCTCMNHVHISFSNFYGHRTFLFQPVIQGDFFYSWPSQLVTNQELNNGEVQVAAPEIILTQFGVWVWSIIK